MPAPLRFTNPATGLPFGQVEQTPPGAIRQAVAELRHSFSTWSAKPLAERIRILRRLQAVLVERRDEISRIINQDCGKSRQDALIELLVSVDMLAQYCSQAPHWLKKKRVSSGLYLFKQCFVEYRPYGVVAVIAPWNYPLALALPPLLAALLAGNTVILKPSEVTAATGTLIEGLIQGVPELAPFVRVVHGDGEAGAALVEARPDFIFFTGSTATGRKIMQSAAQNLIPLALELGGKDAMIVLDDADLPAAARWGAWGAFFNAGQTCMSVERAYVVASRYDAFVRLAVEEAQKFTAGYTPEVASPYRMGPVTDPRQVALIERHLQDAVEKGARLLTGGKREGAFFQPIVLSGVNHSMLLMKEETFGPLLPIMKVEDEAEAIRLANDCTYGLGASVWSRDGKRARTVAGQVQAASIIVNDCVAQFGIPMLPFGGLKESGFGRTHGREGLMQFTQPYSYALGAPPFRGDIATVLRERGHYGLAALLLGLLYGTSLRQRWEALAGWIRQR